VTLLTVIADTIGNGSGAPAAAVNVPSWTMAELARPGMSHASNAGNTWRVLCLSFASSTS
jgi:hypothetical protein